MLHPLKNFIKVKTNKQTIRFKMMKQIICPISDQRINEQVARLNALFAILVLVLAFALSSSLLLVFLAADFFIRGFTGFKYSPIGFASSKLSNALQLSVKPIDKAPKIFAARLGFIMTLVIAVLYLLNYHSAALVVGGILGFFAALEFAFAFCVGCTLYTYLIFPFFRD